MATITCPKCKKQLNNIPEKCPNCGYPIMQAVLNAQKAAATQTTTKKKEKPQAAFKTWKLVSGILSMVLFIFVSFQSCVAGMGNAIFETGESSGSGGILVAIMMLSGGIVSVATRKSKGNGGNIALIVLFGIATLTGYGLAGSFTDLNVWATWCLVNVIMAIIAIIKNNKSK